MGDVELTITQQIEGIQPDDRKTAEVLVSLIKEKLPTLSDEDFTTIDLLITLYILKARVASGVEEESLVQEIGEPDFKNAFGYGKDTRTRLIEPLWDKAVAYVDELVVNNPEAALELGLYMTLLQRDGEHEQIHRWMRGDGPFILAKKDLRSHVQKFLAEDQSATTLIEALHSYLDHNYSELEDDDVIYEDLNCFVIFSTLYFISCLDPEKFTLSNEWQTLYYHAFDICQSNLNGRKILQVFEDKTPKGGYYRELIEEVRENFHLQIQQPQQA